MRLPVFDAYAASRVMSAGQMHHTVGIPALWTGTKATNLRCAKIAFISFESATDRKVTSRGECSPVRMPFVPSKCQDVYRVVQTFSRVTRLPVCRFETAQVVSTKATGPSKGS